MVVYTPHTLVSFGGTLQGVTANDKWQCGIRGGSFNNPSQPFGNSDAFISSLKNDLATWFNAVAQKMHQDATLDWLKINDIGANGKYIAAITHSFYWPTPYTTAGTFRAIPAYMSIAYTWETGLARGLAHRGRIFPPNSGYAITKGSEISTTDAAAAAASGELLLSKIVNASDVATTGADKFNPCVYSAKTGVFNRITGVSCDTAYDEQHRRKEQLKPTRSSVTVDYSTH